MYTALEDIKLETVDFAWIKEATKISHLKRAIKLIELDGDYYSQLKGACYDRIGQLDPSQKRIKIDNRMNEQIKAQINKQLEEWEQQISKKQKAKNKQLGDNKNIFELKEVNSGEGQNTIDLDPQQYFDKDLSKPNNFKEAENEKIKGNQAIKSRDYEQAIRHYTKSIQLNPALYQSYGNRALSYIRLKDFQKALNDCQAAIRINPKYTKAFHRKAKALMGLKKKTEAYKTLQQALKLEPQNSELNAELKDIREQMNPDEIKQLQGNSQFKKIAIQQDSEDEKEQIQEK